ncbi:haloacid dehalogenase type II [Isoptericola cucumis]|uniref:haloacid dehalogenase type II n=1 Tax=Isoptericola cucumis TaxID=1776856 RepID=UPI00166388B8|nr:haloacid dehalogenase type II [Isoptericola cucumis]
MQPLPQDSRPVVVVDVLGTVVDQAGSLTRRVAAATGDEQGAREVVRRWLDHVADSEREIVARRRELAPSHVLDAEALDLLVADGQLPAGAAARLVDASEHLEPWPDAVAGLDLLAAEATVVGLSNASRRTLAGLGGRAGLRWHQVLSAQDAGTYKPAPAIYELALSSAPAGAGTPFMVAAHAWDLRAAAAAGMRTAYVPRPDGDPPRPDDAFDLSAPTLADLAARLRAERG